MTSSSSCPWTAAIRKRYSPATSFRWTFNLNTDRTARDAYTMYGMQNEIRYDSNFFQLVEGSALLSNGISTTDIGLRDNYREFYMNFVSLSGGEEWERPSVWSAPSS